MQVVRTTFLVDGINEPCIEVRNNGTMVRISKFYHYVGRDTLLLKEFIDGDYNSSEEINGDFDTLTKDEAERIAKKFSVYL